VVDALAVIEEDPLVVYLKSIEGFPITYMSRLFGDNYWDKSVGIQLIPKGINVENNSIDLFGTYYFSGASIVNFDGEGKIHWRYNSGEKNTSAIRSLTSLANDRKLLSFTTVVNVPSMDSAYLAQRTTNLRHHLIDSDGNTMREIIEAPYKEKVSLYWGMHEVVKAGITHNFGGLINDSDEVVLLGEMEGEEQEHETKLVLY